MMSRRDLIKTGAAIAVGAAVPAAAEQAAIPLAAGPHLFLDDFLIQQQAGLTRVVHPPERLPVPVLTSARFGTTQPYLGIVRDPERDRLRLWYNRGSQVWHTESADGIEWGEPRLAWDLPRCYGVTVIDDAGRDPVPERRFKLANWQAHREREDRPGDDSGMYVGFSPDGFRWTAYPGNPVLPTWPEGYGTPTHHGVGDIIDAFYDPVHRRYGCAVKVHAIPGDGFPKGPRAGEQFMRRWVGMSVSDDFVKWEKPWQIAVAGSRDQGLTEFYGMGGVHARGALLIGFARVLRDDLPCDAGGPANGIGWSALMTSRDGRSWTRDSEPFLDRTMTGGAWDHAMAWMSGAIPMKDELFLYYGGYARGHKVEAQKERQIGLARMKRDRYVSRRAGETAGTLTTPAVLLQASRLSVNAAIRGELEVRLLDGSRPAGAPLERVRLQGESLAHTVPWKHSGSLRGRPVQLQFRLRDADLFGFELS